MNEAIPSGKRFTQELKKKIGYFIVCEDGFSINEAHEQQPYQFYIDHKKSYISFGLFEDAREYTLRKNAEKALIHLEKANIKCHIIAYDKQNNHFISDDEAEVIYTNVLKLIED
ncbi:hypothetical protein ABD87_22700 [Lysinibacillus sphaericus]|uniref:hypothetical protein n=1 Tax=Lysinibacillus sphaericus TaxID=1421 RepID=UPI0018CF0892|nr:hypothetical protein [Lysinibacillus sphaericus]MBG9732237.1 hypothetical protein [Lysinibacillus sphaericus]